MEREFHTRTTSQASFQNNKNMGPWDSQEVYERIWIDCGLNRKLKLIVQLSISSLSIGFVLSIVLLAYYIIIFLYYEAMILSLYGYIMILLNH